MEFLNFGFKVTMPEGKLCTYFFGQRGQVVVVQTKPNQIFQATDFFETKHQSVTERMRNVRYLLERKKTPKQLMETQGNYFNLKAEC